jgi:NitT/TauT family transport system substrate-binding protein
MAKINIMALRHSAFYAPFLLTMSGGYLKQQGLEYSYAVQTPGNLITDAIRNGTAHLSQSAVATSFAALESGQECDIVHFAQINERDGFFIASRDKDTEFNWHKLAGKNVLVDHLFQPVAMLRYGLHKQGVDMNSLNVIDAGDVSQMDTVFRSGQGDYIHQQGPAPQQLEKEGLAHVVGAVGDIVGPVAFSSICASREWLTTDMAQAFMQAYRQARQFVIESPATDVAGILSPQLPDIDIDVLVSTIDVYKKLGCWTANVNITADAYDNLLAVFMHSDLISSQYPYDRCIVNLPNN